MRSVSAAACARHPLERRASSLANKRSTAPSVTKRSSPLDASSVIRYVEFVDFVGGPTLSEPTLTSSYLKVLPLDLWIMLSQNFNFILIVE